MSMPIQMVDQTPSQQQFLSDVRNGLEQTPKRIPSKYFYDRRGSQLFEKICALDEYYLTRAELEIIDTYASEMAEQLAPGVMLVEYGSGSSVKTRHLLDEMGEAHSYVPVDISREHLRVTARSLQLAFPKIEIAPVCADFTKPFSLPKTRTPRHHAAVYFPGSTIGNFSNAAVHQILCQIARLVGAGGGLLIGIDLHKDSSLIEKAYNDETGVTADFNANVLLRINRELDADFQVDQFEHRAIYNGAERRIEMYLQSCCEQVVDIDGQEFEFEEGESVLTEHSHKYTIDGFAQRAAVAGFRLNKYWTDSQEWFGVLHLVAT